MANKRHTSRRAESLSFARAHLFCGFHQLLLPCNKRLTHLQALRPLMTDLLVMSTPKNIGRGSFSHKIFTFRFPEMKMIENNTFKATNQLMIPVLFLKKLALSKLGPKNPLVNL
jgi:hypothetical protein